MNRLDQSINSKGHLMLGNIDVVDLVREYKTPLYVMDQEYIENQIKSFQNNFKSEKLITSITYASKAFLCKGMCQFLSTKEIHLDVVSGGELYTAISADFPRERICFHGNNKTIKELTEALDANIGLIIVDHRQEYDLLRSLAQQHNKKVNVLLRLNPGIDAHTHEYIQTSKHESKFGESIYSDETLELIERMSKDQWLNLRGFHCHIGSQIFESKSFEQSAETMLVYLLKLKNEIGFETKVLNLGGGFGIYYAKGDKPLDLNESLPKLTKTIESYCDLNKLELEEIMIEPGRSLVANSGTTLYTVGGTKKTYGGKEYIFVDGGMTDNPRPALYQAVYEGVIASKMNEKHDRVMTVAGKCCESGDMLIKDGLFPNVEVKDILAVFGTGAYNYSMASRYNRHGVPSVVWVKNGNSQLMIQGETYEDLIRNDRNFEER